MQFQSTLLVVATAFMVGTNAVNMYAATSFQISFARHCLLKSRD